MIDHSSTEIDNYCRLVGDCNKCFMEKCSCPHHKEPLAGELVEDLEEANAETPTNTCQGV